MKTITVQPVEGRVVPIPERPGETLGSAGAVVPRTPYWVPRLQDGDVVEIKAAQPATASAAGVGEV